MVFIAPPLAKGATGNLLRFRKYGDGVVVSCDVFGSPPITFMWCRRKENRSLPSCSSSSSADLVIHNISRENEGRWTCIASNDVGEAKITVDLYRENSNGEIVIIEGEDVDY